MADLNLLKRARERISSPANWTHGFLARDVTGQECHASADEAVCWCAMGALRASGGRLNSEEGDLLHDVARDLFNKHVFGANDSLGHTAALRIYDRAIELAEQDQ